jgi:hypothetical protein
MAPLDVRQTYQPRGCCRVRSAIAVRRAFLLHGHIVGAIGDLSVEEAARKSAHLAGRRLNVMEIQCRYGLATGSGFGCSASEFR